MDKEQNSCAKCAALRKCAEILERYDSLVDNQYRVGIITGAAGASLVWAVAILIITLLK